jgi:multisubunit Na+/H+ antiporter MnhB subunit
MTSVIRMTHAHQKRIVGRGNLSPLTISLICGTLACLIYLTVAWFLLPFNTLWSPDEGAKLLQMQSMRIEHGRLVYTIPYRGYTFDPDLRFAHWALLSIYNDQLSFGRLPVFSLLTVPFVSCFELRGLYILPALCGGLISIVTLRLWAGQSFRLPVWLLVAFGSPVLIYSVIFWEHTLATALVLTGSMLALRFNAIAHSADSRRLLLWGCIATLFAMSVYIRQETVLLIGALLAAIWFLTPNKRWSIFYTVGLMGVLLLPYVPLHRMTLAGQALPDNASHIFVPFAYIRGAGLQAISDLFVGPFTHGAIDAGWFGHVWSVAAVVAICCGFFYRGVERDTILFVALALNAMSATFLLLIPEYYRSGHGLLFTTPWAILGICRTREIWSSRSYHLRVCLLTVLIGLSMYAVAILVIRGSSPHGGLQWGARFALSFYPILSILALWNWDIRRYDNKLLAVMVILVLLGFGFQARGLWTIWNDKQFNGMLNETITEVPETYILSDLNWLPLNAAPIYNQKTWFVAETPETVVAWVNRAAEKELSFFSIVTLQNSQIIDTLEPVLTENAFEVIAVDVDIGHALILRIGSSEYFEGVLPEPSMHNMPVATWPAKGDYWSQ